MINMTYSTVLKTPCYQCEDRKVTHEYNCHAVCPRYEAYRQGQRETNRINKINSMANGLNMESGKVKVSKWESQSR